MVCLSFRLIASVNSLLAELHDRRLDVHLKTDVCVSHCYYAGARVGPPNVRQSPHRLIHTVTLQPQLSQETLKVFRVEARGPLQKVNVPEELCDRHQLFSLSRFIWNLSASPEFFPRAALDWHIRMFVFFIVLPLLPVKYLLYIINHISEDQNKIFCFHMLPGLLLWYVMVYFYMINNCSPPPTTTTHFSFWLFDFSIVVVVNESKRHSDTSSVNMFELINSFRQRSVAVVSTVTLDASQKWYFWLQASVKTASIIVRVSTFGNPLAPPQVPWLRLLLFQV